MQLLEITEPAESTLIQDKSKVTAIGIDLGTTNSLASFSINQQPVIIKDEHGKDIIPSLISLSPNGEIKVGCLEGAQDFIKSAKRLMGKSYAEIQEISSIPSHIRDNIIEDNGVLKIRLGQALFTPEEISAKVLSSLKESAEKHFGYPIEKAVITIPAYFDDAARNATIFAARLAGLEVLRLVSEPTAAAYSYGLDQGSEGYFLVYDFGGGTFDVSLLNMQMGVFQVIATNGDTMLGGDDIDHIIYDYCLKLLNDNFNINNIDSGTAKALLEAVKKAKESFVDNEKAKINICDITIELSKEVFGDLIRPIIDRTTQILKQTIEQSEVELEEIEGIILVGGSTRICSIKKELTNQLGLKIFDKVDPDRVVALGAALQAENLTQGSQNLLLDVTPLSMGIELMGGIVDKLIPRNTPIPFSVTKQFTTYTDNQTGMQFHVVQGDREIASECRSLTHFELVGIPPMKAGAAVVEVKFTLDADGILFISATEETTGISQEVNLKPSYGLSFEQMQQMLIEAFENAEKDHQYKLLQETIIEAQRVIEVLTVALAENNNMLDKVEYNLIKKQIEKTIELINQGNRQGIIDSVEKLEQTASQFIAAKMSVEMTKALKGTHV
jgi:molecular chaperone HscA